MPPSSNSVRCEDYEVFIVALSKKQTVSCDADSNMEVTGQSEDGNTLRNSKKASAMTNRTNLTVKLVNQDSQLLS